MTSTRKALLALAAVAAVVAGGGQFLVSTVCACSVPQPEARFAPMVSGATTVGETLATTNGIWVTSGNLSTHPNTSYTYKWQRCDAGGASCSNINGATASSYKLVSADANSTIRAVVTAINDGGSTIVTSKPTALVTGNSVSLLFGKSSVGASTNAGLSADVKRVIQGTSTTSGDVVKLSEYFTPTGTVGSQSLRGVLYADTTSGCTAGWTDCPGNLLATSNSITLSNTNAPGWYDLTFPNSPTVADGQTYWLGNISGPTGGIIANKYDVTGGNSRIANTNNGGYAVGPTSPFGTIETTDANEFSAYATVAASGSPVNTVAPAISDQTSANRWQVGDVLTSTTGTWSPSGTPTRQWQRCSASGVQCVDIGGATSTTYTLAPADDGTTIRVVVAETNATGMTSAASDVSGGVTTAIAVGAGDIGNCQSGGVVVCLDFNTIPLTSQWAQVFNPTGTCDFDCPGTISPFCVSNCSTYAANRMQFVTSPTDEAAGGGTGNYALRVELANGDNYCSTYCDPSTTLRNQLRYVSFTQRQDRYFHISWYLDPSMNVADTLTNNGSGHAWRTVFSWPGISNGTCSEGGFGVSGLDGNLNPSTAPGGTPSFYATSDGGNCGASDYNVWHSTFQPQKGAWYEFIVHRYFSTIALSSGSGSSSCAPTNGTGQEELWVEQPGGNYVKQTWTPGSGTCTSADHTILYGANMGNVAGESANMRMGIYRNDSWSNTPDVMYFDGVRASTTFAGAQ